MNGKSIKALLVMLPIAVISAGYNNAAGKGGISATPLAAKSKQVPLILPSKTLKGHSDMVLWLAFDKKGRKLATASADRQVKLWDVKTGKTLQTMMGNRLIVWSVAIAPDGKTLASAGNDGSLRIWDAASGRPRHVIQQGPVVNTVAFSPDGKLIASGRRAGSATDNATLSLWNAQSGKLVRSFVAASPFSVQGVAFSPDGKQLLSGGLDKTMRLWDVKTGRLQKAFTVRRDKKGHYGDIIRVAFSPDGKSIAGGGWDGVGTIWIWNAQSGRLLYTLRGTTGTINGLAFSPDGRTVAGTTHTQAQIWNSKTGKLWKSWMASSALGVKSLAFTPDGHYLVTGSREGDIRVKADRTVVSTMVGTIKFWSIK